MTFETWLAFTAASLVIIVIPGPSILLILSYALSRGKSVAIAAAFGVGLGDLFAMTASLVGLGALMLTSATAFLIIKWVGVIYLVWMGWRMILSTRKTVLDIPPNSADLGAQGIFRHVTIVTALNPKSIGFFVAFAPQFIVYEQPFVPQAVILTATYVILGIANAFLYAMAAAHMRTFIRRPAILTWITRMGGATLIAMGALTAFLRRPAT
ncbi:MAG: LysE family translocator [Pseudomonadota bacterium]